ARFRRIRAASNARLGSGTLAAAALTIAHRSSCGCLDRRRDQCRVNSLVARHARTTNTLPDDAGALGSGVGVTAASNGGAADAGSHAMPALPDQKSAEWSRAVVRGPSSVACPHSACLFDARSQGAKPEGQAEVRPAPSGLAQARGVPDGPIA